jgi:hypothetical protein
MLCASECRCTWLLSDGALRRKFQHRSKIALRQSLCGDINRLTTLACARCERVHFFLLHLAKRGSA